MPIREIVLVQLCDELVEGLIQLDGVRKPPQVRIEEHAYRAQASMRQVPVQNGLLRAVFEHNAVSGVRVRLWRILRHVLQMLAADTKIDPEHACRVLEHVYNENDGEWSPRVSKPAADLGYALTRGPRDITCGSSLADP
jgi:hypothetical protein